MLRRSTPRAAARDALFAACAVGTDMQTTRGPHHDDTAPVLPESGAGTIGAPPADERGPDDDRTPAHGPATAASTDGTLATTAAVLGAHVTDRAGADVGTLDELAIDVATGRVAYALLATASGARHAVPWRALRARDEGFALDVAAAVLRDDAALDEQFWPGLARDERWARDVHRRFGVEPYWQPGSWIGEGQVT
jgi:hypothetical protein